MTKCDEERSHKFTEHKVPAQKGRLRKKLRSVKVLSRTPSNVGKPGERGRAVWNRRNVGNPGECREPGKPREPGVRRKAVSRIVCTAGKVGKVPGHGVRDKGKYVHG